MTENLALSLLVGALVGGAAAYLGSLMVTRRMALVGDALGHVALPGMGLALLAKLDPSLGAFVFLAVGIVVIWKLGHWTALSLETLVGIVFVSSLAAGFLIVPQPELLESLIGDISKIGVESAWIAATLSALVFWILRRIYGGMMLLNLSPELAAVQGVREKKYNFYYLACIALLVSIGVKVTGSLLVGALVILPSATARSFSSHLKQYARNSMALGGLSCVAGVLLSQKVKIPAGPAIILVNAFIFALALGYKAVVGRAQAKYFQL